MSSVYGRQHTRTYSECLGLLRAIHVCVNPVPDPYSASPPSHLVYNNNSSCAGGESGMDFWAARKHVNVAVLSSIGR